MTSLIACRTPEDRVILTAALATPPAALRDKMEAGLDGVEVARGEECLEEGPLLWVVEIDEERPVDEPRA